MTDREKLEEDDHDLLTFGEAGERLRLEIADVEKTIERLKAGGPEAELRKAQARLDALRAAVQRNSADRFNGENFEKFFGYRATPKSTAPSGGQSS
ncbi:putative acyl-CoA synthase [Mycolicibacterium hassiacum DSM 44199]|jgi:hypothetical protein|uniref:Putative acyl-CoA synthase n=1 Tax=Mycolicibacterium hassiacum (strain DSM 44199 / CIP 105218 / JCM 12690 / 3849) TaxID=1122247 RepID=K5BIN4_MYCHD|nr:hypothetical protein [Mycolicibacterium hassiacum]EKF21669.1 putative acyl-CoA synthase [Mycolicibacterium hassiacum DSM 44199]MBX5487484.1 acyl-CoA synthetase [Mycolicibacterium hassiacum]MDA4084241.1 acyl-CoA synthetase [Mycolicibacterium hassiacum DSM 44199]PZN25075.1 MAG: acyl-CoA synthetase [Mycolicibacterium hassiacum]VCT91250.1 hypothetical protein MHAS_02964 [Mycolicibacterium hassiacum DSM 44199]